MLEGKGFTHQVLIRLCELVVDIFQSAKVIIEGTCTDASFGLVNGICKKALDFDARIKRCFAEPRVYIDNRSFSRSRVQENLVPFVCELRNDRKSSSDISDHA
jgi:hypothetical protein